VAAPPLIEKLNGCPTSWVLFEAACLQTFSCALGTLLTKVMTVSVHPPVPRTTAVARRRVNRDFLPVGDKVIDGPRWWRLPPQ